MATIHTIMTGLVSKQAKRLSCLLALKSFPILLTLWLGAVGQGGGTFQPEILYYTATDGLQYAYYYDEQGNIVYPDYGSYQADAANTAQEHYDHDGTLEFCLARL